MEDANIVLFDTDAELTVAPQSGITLPALIEAAGEDTARRFVEFFLVSIRNKNTRSAYAHAVRQFLEWCEERGLEFFSISPIAIAAYVEQHPGSDPTINQHLAAVNSGNYDRSNSGNYGR